MDYLKFLAIKSQLQRLYNFKAKEEREIIYAVKIDDENKKKDESDKSSKNIDESKHDLVAITTIKDNFYLEYINVAKDINFKYSINLSLLIKLTVMNENEVSLKISEKNLELKFINDHSLKEFIWCLIHIFPLINLDCPVQVKGVNNKDLEEYAIKHKFFRFNKIFEGDAKKDKYEIEVSETELEDLNYTLKSINIDSIIQFDLENLNSKIEQFNIETKESFVNILEGSYTKDVSEFLKEISKCENSIKELNNTFQQDTDSIQNIFHSIQKIEDANHRVQLRYENKQKLMDFMRKLIEQLSISKDKESALTDSKYLYNSELVIVSDALEKFVKFYKSRKSQDIKMNIIKEGHDKISKVIDLMNVCFNKSLYENIRENRFNETFLLKNLPSFNHSKIIKFVSNNIKSLNRTSLNNFLADRRFFIEKLNILINNQDELNKNHIFKQCVTSATKGMRDLLAYEFNLAIGLWQVFFESEVLNEQEYNIYLTSEFILKYDAFQNIDTECLFEANKYFSTIILNTFCAVDNCYEILTQFFSEQPCFYLEKNTNLANEIEEILIKKIYEALSNNFNASVEGSNILIGFIIYSILTAIQERISKNIMDDNTLFTLKDIYENLEVDDTNIIVPQVNYTYEDYAPRKISLQETKNFIAKNIHTLNQIINNLLTEQKSIISNFTCEVRRVGIIPIVKKTLNFLKLLVALTNGIKQDYIIEICEDFLSKLKNTIDKLSKIKEKYTNIILIENYYYIHKCFKMFEQAHITNPKFANIENSSYTIYNKYLDEYIKEITDYQFKDFYPYYEKMNYQFNSVGTSVKLQSNYTFNSYDNKVNSFLKELPKNVEKIAKRINKHFCVEEGLTPIVWKHEVNFINSILSNLESLYSSCYDKQINVQLLKNAQDSINNFNIMNIFKNK